MKKLMMVLPLALLLAYCGGPNNTQTTPTNANDNQSAASTTTTVNDEVAVTSTDMSDVNTNTAVITTNVNARPINMTSPLPADTNDPIYQHWQRTNGQYWTWDYNYPGYDRPMAGTYNTQVSGNWSLLMTPELVSAWRPDNSRSLWKSDYSYSGTKLGNTYVSASESFNTTGDASLNNNTSNTTTDATVTTNSSMDVNSINYNAYNGNMYQMPKFNLYLDNGSFTAYTGCNSISGRVHVSGSTLHFLNTSASTNIDCHGGLDQGVLIDLLNRVDSYAYVNDELQLMQGNQVLLRFKKGTATLQ